MHKTNNLKPIIFLIISWLLVLISFYFEAILGGFLFSRSGSLMVLFAVMAEYNLLRTREKYHRDQFRKYSRGNQVNLDEIHPSKSHKYLEKAAHINVVLGTILWGYGDLLFQ